MRFDRSKAEALKKGFARQERRRKTRLCKWMTENWDGYLADFFQHVYLIDTNGVAHPRMPTQDDEADDQGIWPAPDVHGSPSIKGELTMNL